MSTEDFPEASFEAALAAAGLAAATAEPPPVETAPAVPAPAVTPPASAQPGDPGPIPQYLLDREAALEAREKATRDAEAKASAAMERANSLEARERTLAKQAEAFDSDPVGFVRSLRPDLTAAQAARYAERMYAHALGKEAPLELRLEQKIAEIDRNAQQANERLSKQLEDQQRQAAEAHRTAQLAEYTAHLKGSVGVVKPTEHPILSSLATKSPDEYASELMHEAIQDCQRQYAANPNVEPVPPPPAELAKRAEARLKALVDKYAPAATAPAPQTPPAHINNRTAAVQGSRSAPDPDDDRTLRAQALKEAGLEHIPVW